MAVEYRNWGYDADGSRDWRSGDDVHPQDRSYTRDVYGTSSSRDGGAHRAGGEADDPYIGPGSIYRGRRRQEEDAPVDDRPYGRRSARERWRESETADPQSGEWTREAYTGEWTREGHTGEWTRGAYTGEWSRGDEAGRWEAPERWTESPRSAPPAARDPLRDTGWRAPRDPEGDDWRRGRAGDTGSGRWDRTTDTGEWLPPRQLPPASGIPASGMPASGIPASGMPSSAIPSSGIPGRMERPPWAVGRDPSPTGRRRWQDQVEPLSRQDQVEPLSRQDQLAPSPRQDPVEPVYRQDPVEPQYRPDQFEPRWTTGGDFDDEPRARLSTDDPRWVGIPSSAPRSPVVGYPDDRDFRSRPPVSRTGPPTSARQRPASPSIRRRSSLADLPDDEDDAPDAARGGVMAAILATLAWYAVPLLLFAVYIFTVGTDARAQAITSLFNSGTRIGAALALSVVVAVLVRWVSNSWRSASVGLAAAVVGGGLSTVLLSAISGQPIG